jgi:hypothetical protein
MLRSTGVLAVLTVAACATTPAADSSGAAPAAAQPGPSPAVGAVSPAPLDPSAPESRHIAFAKGPFAPIASADGLWTMEIVALNTETPPEPPGGRWMSASVCFRPAAGDALVVGPPTLRVADAAGAEPRTDPKWTSVWSAGTSVALLAPVPADADRLGFAEMQCRLMRVAEWRTTEVVLEKEGQKAAVASPFRLFCSPDATWIWVSASLDAATFREPEKAEVVALGHRWAAGAADVTDARGAKLTPHGGSGSGGASAMQYHADEGNGTLRVVYPATVRLRVPVRYDVQDVVFRLDGLALPRKPAAR